jgi:thymidylate kinase
MEMSKKEKRFIIINGTNSINDIHKQIMSIIEKRVSNNE